MRNTKQDRWTCQFCKASGWWTPSTHIGLSPLFDHDRPQGGKCRAVEKHCREPYCNDLAEPGGVLDEEEVTP